MNKNDKRCGAFIISISSKNVKDYNLYLQMKLRKIIIPRDTYFKFFVLFKYSYICSNSIKS